MINIFLCAAEMSYLKKILTLLDLEETGDNLQANLNKLLAMVEEEKPKIWEQSTSTFLARIVSRS